MRAAPSDNWDDTLPIADRERYAAAWQSYMCCRDCAHWTDDGDGDGTGACCHPVLAKYAAYLTPEDFTCDEFSPIKKS